MIKRINGPKDVGQITRIIENSRSYFEQKCAHYYAISDSIYNSILLRTRQDSMVVPEKNQKN